MGRIIPAIAVAALLSVSACSDRPTTPAASPAVAPSTVPTTMPAPLRSLAADDYDSEVACRLLDDATRSELSTGIDEDTLLGIIAHATKSSDPDLKLAGQMLKERHESAVALSYGEDRDKQKQADDLVDAAVAKLRVACIDVGLLEP